MATSFKWIGKQEQFLNVLIVYYLQGYLSIAGWEESKGEFFDLFLYIYQHIFGISVR